MGGGLCKEIDILFAAMSTNCGDRASAAFGICMLRLGPWLGCVCVYICTYVSAIVWTRLKLQNGRRHVCDACAKCCSNCKCSSNCFTHAGREEEERENMREQLHT